MSSRERLLGLIREHSWTRHRKVLLCAPDVEESLRRVAIKTAEHCSDVYFTNEAVLLALMGIDVVIAQDSAPGTWQLTRHDYCEVTLAENEDGTTDPERSRVSHGKCTVIARHPE